MHGKNDSIQAAGNLIEILGPYLLAYQFSDIGNAYGLSRVSARLPESTEKLSTLCLRYCTRFLLDGNEEVGEQYFHLSAALSLRIKKNPLYNKIKDYWDSSVSEKAQICEQLKIEDNLVTRKVSYDPPKGSETLHC